ncbi:MAG: tyrosine-type recombinase/integrase [Pseudomonadota bacterium]
MMIGANIPDVPDRIAKGIRHSYSIAAVTNGIPLNVLKKWLGYQSIETTAIYADAVEKEEQAPARKMW